ncbi:iron-hydroxamate ABC transporter substrate-binding protein [Mesobacillus subterraneus]|uniref:Iron-hydroxamate ABC transporter substrate-binding protein n=1 Tax=Mesobacillus subterraneus TaxID=285983 RepID=A0A3R9E4I3_9BACI|nr:iron-hydroxamate ABC transporter substrate-binding protein [Mesobacillus subterraneus]RSD25900.1 iron-hydroxamate ABC transporter substrate-binding protein [Mesobacillus subterraneus]
MKKLIMPFLLMLVLLLSACGGETTEKSSEKKEANKSETITYQSENGDVEVPANPERVIVLSSFAGNVMALDVNIVGVDSWSKMNPRFEKLKDVEEVTDENLEKIIELDPDLIIGLSTIKNVDKLKEIAPTVTFTYGKLDYLNQHLEIGKLLNKEKEAQEWIDSFKADSKAAGEEIKAKIGEDATVSVIENFDKELYVFGDNWARGTEILYQEMKLNMPEKVKQMALEQGYYAISPEVLSEYAGDYVIFSKNAEGDTSFQQTETYKNIPAVKNNQVFEANAKEFYFNDPLTLEYQLEFFKKSFLGQ